MVMNLNPGSIVMELAETEQFEVKAAILDLVIGSSQR
jgi:hypothetical protein